MLGGVVRQKKTVRTLLTVALIFEIFIEKPYKAVVDLYFLLLLQGLHFGAYWILFP